ncbi:MAG TPA: TetR/AcrR family transcriptional regulator [Acidimicrobiales bacterium]|nr:TetR/AcrR family transcriptional regulator [Acidimicrobiales bacterium]
MTPGSSEAAGGAGEAGFGGLDLALPDPLRHELERVDRDVAALADELATDGRLARGRRTRHNVAEALVALLREGDPDPTAKAVAARAGVSLRLVFHHFADMDDLYHFVAALQLRRQWADMPRLSPRLALLSRIERTVSHRAVLFEDISPVRRALARRAPSSPAVAQAVTAADNLLLESLRATFAPELREIPALTIRAEYLGALDATTSWELWERLRTSSGIGVRPARRVVARMLTVLCAGPRGSGLAGSGLGGVPGPGPALSGG